MDAAALALAALIVVPLAQVPLVAYLSRYVELEEGAPRQDPREGYVTYGTEPARDAVADSDAGSTRTESVCPHCEHPVDGPYDYCANCAGRIASRGVRR